MGKRLSIVALLLVATPAVTTAQIVAQPTPAAYTRAVAAGYKAAMYCAGIFNAGRTPAQIDADELAGIYPDYAPIVPTLNADIDRDLRTVDVAFDPQWEPRHAVWDSRDGCELLPIGAQGASSMEDEIDAKGQVTTPSIGPRPADRRVWPLGDAGIAPHPSARLDGIVAAAFDSSYGVGAKTTGVVILRDGKVIGERYAAGWGPFVSNRTWSVGKSIAGTMIGIASPDAAAIAARPTGLSQWAMPQDPRGQITLDHLLRMASGLHSDTAGNRTDAIYFGGTAVDEQAPGWPLEVRPGTRFRYANNDILLAILATRQQIGEQRYRRLATDLFAPLGMTHTVAERDWRGNYVMSSQVWSTARDLARLGQFWLQDGVWQRKRLLPVGWVTYLTTPSGPQPADGAGYGATMWLFGAKQGLPDGSYAAQGNRGQYVMVIPSRRLVIVRRGEDPGKARFDIARFAADIAAALR